MVVVVVLCVCVCVCECVRPPSVVGTNQFLLLFPLAAAFAVLSPLPAGVGFVLFFLFRLCVLLSSAFLSLLPLFALLVLVSFPPVRLALLSSLSPSPARFCFLVVSLLLFCVLVCLLCWCGVYFSFLSLAACSSAR